MMESDGGRAPIAAIDIPRAMHPIDVAFAAYYVSDVL